MKRVFAILCMFVAACDGSTPITPEPPPVLDGGESSSSSSSASSTSSSSSSSSSASSSSGSSTSGGPGDGMSGSRLRRQAIVGTDGLYAPISGLFYDSMLNANCNSLPTPQGNRCLSINLITQYIYGDAACTQDVVTVSKACAPPSYALKTELQPAQCAGSVVYRAYWTGAKLPTAYQKSGMNCVEWQASQNTTLDVYAMGTEVDYAQFVQVTTEVE